MPSCQARYLHTLNQLAADYAAEVGGDGFDSYEVQAKLAVLRKRWRDAENVYVSQGKIEEAITMYTEAHRWTDAIRVAERNNHPEAESLKRSHYQVGRELGPQIDRARCSSDHGVAALHLRRRADSGIDALALRSGCLRPARRSRLGR